jgi:flagellar hook-associated protein 3 FlgL
MRVTATTQYYTMANDLENSLSRFQELQSKVASGKTLQKYSDSPSDTVSVLRYAAQQTDLNAYNRSADDAQTWASSSDGALHSASTLLQRVKTLAITAVNGAQSTDGRAALADEVDSLNQQLASIANTTVGGRGLFSGMQDTAVTQTSGTWNFVGDSQAVNRQIGVSNTLRVNVDGAAVFGFTAGAGQDVFSTLSKLSADIRSGNTTSITADQTTLDARYSNITAALGTTGDLENAITAQQNYNTTTLDTLAGQQSTLEEADLPGTILKMSQAQTGYQAALAAAAQANLPSLADYLK